MIRRLSELSRSASPFADRQNSRHRGRCKVRYAPRPFPPPVPPARAPHRHQQKRDAHAASLQASHNVSQKNAVLAEIPAVVGGRLRRIVGHQRHLFRLRLFAKNEKVLGRIPLNVEFRAGKLSSISARRTGRSEKRIWRWSGRGCTVSPLAPAASAKCPKCATSGHGRSRRLRSMAIAFRLTESFAGMTSGSGSELTSCFTQVDANRKEADKIFGIRERKHTIHVTVLM